MNDRPDITIEDPAEIVQLIMTQHWDLGACPCWVCCAGRVFGLHATSDFLGFRSQGFEYVSVPDPDVSPFELRPLAP